MSYTIPEMLQRLEMLEMLELILTYRNTFARVISVAKVPTTSISLVPGALVASPL